jgi:TolA-binding protein
VPRSARTPVRALALLLALIPSAGVAAPAKPAKRKPAKSPSREGQKAKGAGGPSPRGRRPVLRQAAGAPATATATPAGAPSNAALTGQAGGNARESEIYGDRLDGIEAEVAALKDKVFRSKARLAVLRDTVLSGVMAGGRVIVAHRNLMGVGFRLIRVVVILDGAQIFARSDETGSLDAEDELPIFDGNLPPGPHEITVELVYQGQGYGAFDYLKGYTFKSSSNHSFAVGESGQFKLVSKGYERGNLTTEMKDRPAVEWQTVAIDASGAPTAEPGRQVAAVPAPCRLAPALASPWSSALLAPATCRPMAQGTGHLSLGTALLAPPPRAPRRPSSRPTSAASPPRSPSAEDTATAAAKVAGPPRASAAPASWPGAWSPARSCCARRTASAPPSCSSTCSRTPPTRPPPSQARFYLGEALLLLGMRRWAAECFSRTLADPGADGAAPAPARGRPPARPRQPGAGPRPRARPGLGAMPELRARMQALGLLARRPADARRRPARRARPARHPAPARLGPGDRPRPADRRAALRLRPPPVPQQGVQRRVRRARRAHAGDAAVQPEEPRRPLARARDLHRRRVGGGARPARRGDRPLRQDPRRHPRASPTARSATSPGWPAPASTSTRTTRLEALRAYRQIGRDSPMFAEAMYETAWALLRAGRHEVALTALDVVLTHDPDGPVAPEALQLRGKLHVQQRSWKAAEKEFTALRRDFEGKAKSLAAALTVEADAAAYYTEVARAEGPEFHLGALLPRGAGVFARTCAAPPRPSTWPARQAPRRTLRETRDLLARMESAAAATERPRVFTDLGAHWTAIDAAHFELAEASEVAGEGRREARAGRLPQARGPARQPARARRPASAPATRARRGSSATPPRAAAGRRPIASLRAQLLALERGQLTSGRPRTPAFFSEATALRAALADSEAEAAGLRARISHGRDPALHRPDPRRPPPRRRRLPQLPGRRPRGGQQGRQRPRDQDLLARMRPRRPEPRRRPREGRGRRRQAPRRRPRRAPRGAGQPRSIRRRVRRAAPARPTPPSARRPPPPSATCAASCATGPCAARSACSTSPGPSRHGEQDEAERLERTRDQAIKELDRALDQVMEDDRMNRLLLAAMSLPDWCPARAAPRRRQAEARAPARRSTWQGLARRARLRPRARADRPQRRQPAWSPPSPLRARTPEEMQALASMEQILARYRNAARVERHPRPSCSPSRPSRAAASSTNATASASTQRRDRPASCAPTRSPATKNSWRRTPTTRRGPRRSCSASPSCCSPPTATASPARKTPTTTP